MKGQTTTKKIDVCCSVSGGVTPCGPVTPASRKTGWLVLLFMVVCYFAVRLPLLQEDLGLEEGIFAELIVNRPAGPQYCLLGRIAGEKMYGLISHPAFLYEPLRFGGWVFQSFLSAPVCLDDVLVTPRLRALSSLYPLLFWAALLTLVSFGRVFPFRRSVLLLFAAALSPLAIRTSMQLQVDNTSGVLLCGFAAAGFVMASRLRLSGRMRIFLLLGGGFAAGLGKQEWSFALLLALITTAVVSKFIQGGLSRECLVSLGAILLGLCAGNLFSYLYDPENYSRGIYYIGVFSKLTSISGQRWSFARWLELTLDRIPYLYVCVAFLGIFLFFAAVKRQTLSPLTGLVALYGFFLFMGYVVSDHSSSLRYFAPSLAVLTVAVLAVLPAQSTRWGYRVIGFFALSVLITTLVYLVGYAPDKNGTLVQLNQGNYALSSNVVLYADDGAVWNKPEIDYIISNMNYENNKRRIQQQYGKELVYPESLLREPKQPDEGRPRTKKGVD